MGVSQVDPLPSAPTPLIRIQHPAGRSRTGTVI
jgi:hypothetical protein